VKSSSSRGVRKKSNDRVGRIAHYCDEHIDLANVTGAIAALKSELSTRLEAIAADAFDFSAQRPVKGVVTQQSIVVASIGCGNVAWDRLTLPGGRLREVMRGLKSSLPGRRVALR
jgi:hypothetical protein